MQNMFIQMKINPRTLDTLQSKTILENMRHHIQENT